MNLIMMFLLSIVLGGLVLLAAVLLLLSLKNRVVSGKEGMIGEKGIAPLRRLKSARMMTLLSVPLRGFF